VTDSSAEAVVIEDCGHAVNHGAAKLPESTWTALARLVE